MANSNGAKLSQTAHYYQECSNKGVCDRTKGQCQCLDGYEGVACQRASCPGTPTCSGHGTCQSISQLAAKDNNNVYNLWDKDSTMGCLCDSGYQGPDCSERQCKYGVDPLYLDDTSTVKYSEFNFATLLAVPDATADPTDLKKIFTNGLKDTSTGNGQWAIRFYDANGEDWLTDPLDGFATCDDILNALYALPNNAVPLNSVYCEAAAKTTKSEIADFVIDTTGSGGQWQNVPGGSTINSRDGITKVGVGSKLAFWEIGGGASASYLQLLLQGEINSVLADAVTKGTGTTDSLTSSITANAASAKLLGAVYNLRFLGNPGKLKQPEIEIYLDGNRPSLLTDIANGKVITKVWTDGQQGENVDYFADHCDGIQVTIDTSATPYKLGFSDAAWKEKLKTCLGGSDFNNYNNIDVNNWDKGNKYFPHLIKLVKSPTIYTDGGYYVPIYSDGTNFFLVNKFKAPGDPGTGASTFLYDVYTTTGTLALVSEVAEASFGFGSKNIFTYNPLFNPTTAGNPYSGDVSCDLYTGADIYETEGSGTDYNLAKTKNIFPIIDTTKSSCTANTTPQDCDDLDTVITTTATKGQPIYYSADQGTLTAATAKYHQGPANSYCLNKGDLLLLLNWKTPASNPQFINMYTVNNLKTVPSSATLTSPTRPSTTTNHIISVDISTNWAHNYGEDPDLANDKLDKTLVYKFIPAKASSYNYVAECSNRGICARDTGVCQCFPGYSADNCHTQSSLAL